MRGFEEFETAPFLERDLPVRQLDLEIGRHVSRPEENRDLAQRRSFLVQLQYAIDHELCLLLLEQQQTQFVVDRILELHEEGTPLREIAVLFRAGYMSADLEIELTNRKIPFEKWGGLKFLEAAHVKDVLAFLRILENPRDEVSWYRILLLLPGIGDATARSAIEAMASAAWESAAFGR